MLLHINFHKLELMQGSSYIELLKCIALRKAEIDKKKSLLHELFNGFWTASARGKHYEHCSSNILVKVKMRFKKKIVEIS